MPRRQFRSVAATAAVIFSVVIASQFDSTAALTRATMPSASQQEDDPPRGKRSTPDSENSSQVSQEEEQRLEAEVVEIMAIRNRLGGGVAEQLKNLDLSFAPKEPQTDQQSPADDDARKQQLFQEQLIKQMQQRELPTQSESNSRLMTPQQPELGPQSTAPSAPAQISAVQVNQIRQAARMLEEAAALLEEAGQYHQSDRIRDNAKALWQSAR